MCLVSIFIFFMHWVCPSVIHCKSSRQHKIIPASVSYTTYLPDVVQLLSHDMLHACVRAVKPLSASLGRFWCKNYRHALFSLLQYLFPWGSETLNKDLAKRTGSSTHLHSDTVYIVSLDRLTFFQPHRKIL